MAKERKKSEFGEYLSQLIKNAGMSQYEFYTEAGITKPYFYDMLSGRTNPPPRETLERMVKVLEKHLLQDNNLRIELLNCAAKFRNEIPYDISETILEHPEIWNKLRESLSPIVKSDK